jgi:DNA-binding MarR family transcriptional regulator
LKSFLTAKFARKFKLRHHHIAALVDCIYRYTICFLRAFGPDGNHRGSMKKLTLSDYQALAEFRYQIRQFLHFSEQAVKEAGLERGQYQLMLAIKGMPEGVRPRIRELASRMQIQHHSAVELINRLETGGYVRRKRARNDRREVLLALTPKGERVLAELALHHHEQLQSRAPTLVTALRRLMGNEHKPVPRTRGSTATSSRQTDMDNQLR